MHSLKGLFINNQSCSLKANDIWSQNVVIAVQDVLSDNVEDDYNLFLFHTNDLVPPCVSVIDFIENETGGFL